MFVRPPRISTIEIQSFISNCAESSRIADTLALPDQRASKALRLNDSSKTQGKSLNFAADGQVLSIQGPAVQKNMKWPASESKFTEPYTVKAAMHPQYALECLSGNQTRRTVNARKLLRNHYSHVTVID